MEYINRELSWLEFNARVLGGALRPGQPLLEAAKFLGITSSNLDEFFMVRIASLKHEDAAARSCPSGLRAGEILEACAARVRKIIDAQYGFLMERLLPELEREGVSFLRVSGPSAGGYQHLESLFQREVFPVLTPRAVDGDHPPLLAGLRLHVAFLLRPVRPGPETEPLLGVVQIPASVERVRQVPGRDAQKTAFVLVEEIVLRFGAELFPGHRVLDAAVFRVTRDADLDVDEQRDEGYLEAMQQILRRRATSPAMRLEVQSGRAEIRNRLASLLGLAAEDVFEIPGPLDLKYLMGLPLGSAFDRLRHPAWAPRPSPSVPAEGELWDVLKSHDVLLHHPYESFEPVSRLLEQAAADPAVLAIKMTLYRTSGDSPIVRALLKAAQQGKHVVAVVELKARFDEERNIEWAQALQDAGAIVIWGIAGMKVHAKATMIVRREAGGIVRYLHLGTGNYNDRTAAQYTDLGYLTTREELARDAALFFNAITGYSSAPTLGHLVMAPTAMKARLAALIKRETARSTPYSPGRIVAKMNALVDPELIGLLYDASAAGVEISLNVRGICCLRPGVRGSSDSIRIVSVVDHYLEHARIFYFHNGGDPELYLSSADWMPRNLDRRVELMFPILDPALRKRAIDVLMLPFSDTSNAYALEPDGTYVPVPPRPGEKPLRSQEYLTRQAQASAESQADTSRREMRVLGKARD
jgi:polyphosphate kinase